MSPVTECVTRDMMYYIYERAYNPNRQDPKHAGRGEAGQQVSIRLRT